MWLRIQALTLLLFFAADTLGTIVIRLANQQSQWTVLGAALAGLLWIYSVKAATQKGTTIAAMLGILLGVELGILVPL